VQSRSIHHPLAWLAISALVITIFIDMSRKPPVVLAEANGSGSLIGDNIEAQVSFDAPDTKDPCSWHVVTSITPTPGPSSGPITIRSRNGIDDVLYVRRCPTDQSLHWIPQTTSSRVAQHSESKVSRLVNMLLIKTAPPSNKMVVNVGTWFWVPRSVWKSVSVTAYIPTSVGPISVTTTAIPTSLIYSPGDGNKAVTCKGPGTPWSQSRGDNDTSNCMYTYTSASHTRQAGTYAANTAIKWTVTWRSNLGIGGLLPSIRTGLTTSVRVLEMQALSR
jgi:hypothetical protein